MHGNYHVIFVLQILLELVPFLLQIVVRARIYLYWLAVLSILLISCITIIFLRVRCDRGKNGFEFLERSIVVSKNGHFSCQRELLAEILNVYLACHLFYYWRN